MHLSYVDVKTIGIGLHHGGNANETSASFSRSPKNNPWHTSIFSTQPERCHRRTHGYGKAEVDDGLEFGSKCPNSTADDPLVCAPTKGLPLGV